MEDKIININSRNTDNRGRLLSNLINRPFIIDGEWCASPEALFASVLYPETDINHKRALYSCYALSQKMVQDGKDEYRREHAWWNGITMKYGSQEHKDLCERAILECTLQNKDRYDALMETKGYTLTHETGTVEELNNFLTREEFVAIVTKIRESL